MASLDHRLNPLFSIKECMTCGALYTADFCCSKGGLEDKILVPKPPQNCATCGNPVDGLYCRSCAFVRKCLNEGVFIIHDVKGKFKPSEPSNHILYRSSIISNPEQCNQTIAELPQTLPSVHPTCNSGDENSFTYDPKPNYVDDSPNVFNPPPQPSLNSCEFCGNDARIGHYLHLSTSVENLVQIPSEFKGISEDTCDVPVCEDPSTFDALSNHYEILSDSNDDGTSSDDDSYENIEYIEASPLNLEYDSLEEVNADQEETAFDLEDILQIQDVILREKLCRVDWHCLFLLHNHLLELPEFESFHFDLDPSFPRPPPEPPDVEISLIIETDAPVINNFDELNEDECFDPGGDEIDVEDDDSFTFVIRTFLPFLTYPKSLTSQEAPIGQFPKENDTRGLKKAHKEWDFYTKSCLKEAQRPLTHGCHVGNPCAPQSNPTVDIKHLMIEGMKGQDPREARRSRSIFDRL
ncbi:hypothetical protein Tco_0502211 [Tanacetum coccineum]